jgi:hypothetical protein
MCTVGGVAYRLGCVHLSPSAPYCHEHTPTCRLLNVVSIFASVHHTLKISPQFPILEMTIWRSNFLIELHSLMMDQWGPKHVGVLYITTLNCVHFVGLFCNNYFTLILIRILFTEQATTAVNFYTCILEGTSLNLCRETGHLHWILREFPPILTEIYGINYSIR